MSIKEEAGYKERGLIILLMVTVYVDWIVGFTDDKLMVMVLLTTVHVGVHDVLEVNATSLGMVRVITELLDYNNWFC